MDLDVGCVKCVDHNTSYVMFVQVPYQFHFEKV